MSRLWILSVLGLIAVLGFACGDSGDAVGPSSNASQTAAVSTTAAAVSSTPAISLSPSPADTATTYTNDRFGYSLELPTGWRVATKFMDSFGQLLAGPQGGGNSEDYLVLTDLSAEEESQFVQQASVTTGGLTGIEPWLEFFILDTVEIYPTRSSLSQELLSATQGNVKHIVTDVQGVPVGMDSTGTRYTLELDSDYGHFLYDSVFVPATVNGCPECSGFIIQTAIAGRSLQSPGPIEPPPAAYPKGPFESVVSSFESTTTASNHYGESSETTVSQYVVAPTLASYRSPTGFTIDRPSGSQFNYSGYNRSAAGLSQRYYLLVVYAHGALSFSNARIQVTHVIFVMS